MAGAQQGLLVSCTQHTRAAARHASVSQRSHCPTTYYPPPPPPPHPAGLCPLAEASQAGIDFWLKAAGCCPAAAASADDASPAATGP